MLATIAAVVLALSSHTHIDHRAATLHQMHTDRTRAVCALIRQTHPRHTCHR